MAQAPHLFSVRARTGCAPAGCLHDIAQPAGERPGREAPRPLSGPGLAGGGVD
jgi:hypothetical protein